MREGDALSLIAYGQMVSLALQAAEELAERGFDIRVINMSTIEPLDHAILERAASETGALVVVEEHQLNGGLGESIARFLSQTFPVPMGFVAMPNAFGESGTPDELMDRFNLDKGSIIRTSLETLKRK